MLVHKRTMGALVWFWTGRYATDCKGVRYPVMKEYSFATNPELSREEWWEITENSTLGRAVEAAYPYCEPVVGEDGELLSVILRRGQRRDGRENEKDGQGQGKRRRRQRRRAGLFEAMLGNQKQEEQ